MKLFFFTITLILFIPLVTIAQKTVVWQDGQRNLVQFSGIIVEGDSLHSIPYTSIIVKGSHRGTISDYFGYFSFVAQESDTIEFSAIGFQSASFIIPDTLSNNQYSLIQVLRTDTARLSLIEVYPWPTKEQFKKAFLKLDLPEDDIVRADRNMNRSDNKDLMTGMAMDAGLNQQYTAQKYQSKMYYAGQMPPNNLLNPIAWAKFIKAWQNGDFKSKK